MTDHQHRFRALIGLACSAICLAAPTAAGAATPSIRTDPSLFPAFNPAISDYGLTCRTGTVRFTGSSSDSTSISLEGGPSAQQSIDTSLHLSEGQSISWTLSKRVGARTSTTTYHARCVPADMNLPVVTRSGTPTGALYLLSTGSVPTLGQDLNPFTTWYSALFDRNGVPIWWVKRPFTQLDPTILDSKTIALWVPLGHPNLLGDFGFGRWQTYSFDDRLKSTLSAPDPGYDIHELQPGSAKGRYLTVTYRKEGPYDLTQEEAPAQAWGYRAVVQEVTAAGTVKWKWDAGEHISPSELSAWWRSVQALRTVHVDGLPAFDLDHISSARIDGNGVIVAFRHLDAVYRIDRPTGNIVWKLGGTPTPKSLRLIGGPYGDSPIGAPHDAFALSGGRIGLMDVGLGHNHRPRFVVYRIDPAAMTATFVSQIDSPLDTRPICCGSARQLKSGNWAISWPGQPLTGEYSPDGTPVLTFTLPEHKFSYRMQAFEKGYFSLATLRAAMDAQYPKSSAGY
jgi:hypothetical protein